MELCCQSGRVSGGLANAMRKGEGYTLIATFNGPSRAHGQGVHLQVLDCYVVLWGRETPDFTTMSLHASVYSPSTASIRNWLDGVPSPQPTTIGRKRKLCNNETMVASPNVARRCKAEVLTSSHGMMPGT